MLMTISQSGQPPVGTIVNSNGGVSCVAGLGCACITAQSAIVISKRPTFGIMR
jgi:hypothetical protein